MRDTEARFSPQAYWPLSPRDADGDDTAPMYDLYFGACGVIWALDYLRAVGAATLERDYTDALEPLRALNQASLEKARLADGPSASYLCGDTGILMVEQALRPAATTSARLEALIAGNLDHPSRELMWGAPGTTLAALFLYRSTGEARWADWFRAGARALWSQLERFPQHGCSLWVQDLYGHRVEYLGAVHGFVSGVIPIVQGRDLLSPREWAGWKQCIAETVIATAMRMDGMANWRPTLDVPPGSTDKRLCSYVMARPGSSSDSATFPRASSTRCCSPQPRRSGPPARSPRDRTSATAPAATATRSSSSSRAPATSAGSHERARSPCTASTRPARCAALRPDALLAVDRRSRVRDLPVGLPPRRGSLPDAGRVLRRASLDRGACRQGRSGGRPRKPTDGAPRAPCQRHNRGGARAGIGSAARARGERKDAPARQFRAVEEVTPMNVQTLAIAVLGAGLAASLPFAFAQGGLPSTSSAVSGMAAASESLPSARTGRARLAYADARVCLDFPTNPQVIACAEKYRPDR